MEDNQVLPQGATRTQGKNAQRINIQVAKLVAGIVKSTLGPRGMDKLLVDHLGDVTVTNDGVTILREMTIENPVAKMMVNIAKTQENEVGDGTTTAVILAGELLNNAQELLNKNIHPTVISKGYKIASEEADKILKEIAQPLSVMTTEEKRVVLINISKTAMTGKGAEDQKELLSEIVVDAIQKVIDKEGKVSLDDIKVEKREGESVQDTRIIDGVTLETGRMHPNMPKKIINPKIALIDQALEVKSLDGDARINISDPEQMAKFYQSEAAQIKELIDKILESKANVVVCGRGIDDSAVHFLAKNGIFAVRRIPRDDMEKVAKSTGASIITDLNDLSEEVLGKAELIEERFVGSSNMTFIEGCKEAKSVTILVRGSTEQVTAEVKRAIEDALGDVASMVRTGFAVGGAGSTEMILSRRLREFATKNTGRIQLAIEAFADAMEIIPETLAENAGLDPIDIMASLKKEIQNVNMAWPGVDVDNACASDAWERGIIEPLKVKTQAVSSAAEVAIMVLRIDDVIATMSDPDQKKAQASAQQGY